MHELTVTTFASYAADRHRPERIVPGIKAGFIVVADRYLYGLARNA